MTHQGLTWDHPRGYDALAASAERVATDDGRPLVAWAKQPLEGFESHPIADLAAQYDLLVLDHPHIGEALAADCLVPLEELFSHGEIEAWSDQTIGPAMASYEWDGRHFAVPLDVATQVMAWRPDFNPARPATWEAVVRLAESMPVAVSLAGPHALCSFLSIVVATGEEPGGDMLVSEAAATEALAILGRLARNAPRGSDALNPIGLLDAMATSDRIALVPLVYGYVNYARRFDDRRPLAFADAPLFTDGGRPGSVLGGTGLAVTRRAKPDAALLDYIRWLMRVDVQSGFIPEHNGQPSARAAWHSEAVNRTAAGFYSNTVHTVEAAWIRPRHDGFIAFQSEGSAIVRDAVLHGGSRAATIDKLRAAWVRSLATRPKARP